MHRVAGYRNKTNIETEIAQALQKTNGSVSWSVIAEIVAGGPGRVQPVNRTTIAKFVTSTDGAQYTATKLQPTLTPVHKERCCGIPPKG